MVGIESHSVAGRGETKLQQFYDANDGVVSPHLQWIFDTPLETRMGWTNGNIRIWLNAWKPVVDESYTTELSTG